MRASLPILLAASVGCWSSGPKARIEGSIQVFDPPADVDIADVQASLQRRISALPGVEDGGKPVQLLVRFQRRVRVQDETPVEELILHLGFKPLGKGDEELRVSASAVGTEPDALIEPAVDAFAASWALRRASKRAVVENLHAKEELRRRAAIVEAGRRRIESAVEVLSKHLERDATSDEEALLLIEALVSIGDPSAAPALIDATDRESPLVWPPVLFGLSRLGGRQAEGFLFTVAQGHPNPDVRSRARLALDEIVRTDESTPE